MCRYARVEELRILGLLDLLRAWSMTRYRANICHLLLIHREVLLIEVLQPRLVIIRLDHLLDAAGEGSLGTSLRLGIYGLMLLRQFLTLLLVS